MELNDNADKINHKKNIGYHKKNIQGMIKDLFSNDFLNEDITNFSRTKYDKGNYLIIFNC